MAALRDAAFRALPLASPTSPQPFATTSATAAARWLYSASPNATLPGPCPHAAQALQIRRRRRRLDQPKRFTTETVYAITDLLVHQARPEHLAGWIRGHWSIENKVHWVRDVTYDEDRSQIRTGTGPQVMASLRNAAIGALRLTGITNIAAANRHHARDSNRSLALLGIT